MKSNRYASGLIRSYLNVEIPEFIEVEIRNRNNSLLFQIVDWEVSK